MLRSFLPLILPLSTRVGAIRGAGKDNHERRPFRFRENERSNSNLERVVENALRNNEAYHEQIDKWEMYLENTPLPEYANEKLRVYIATLKKAYANLTEFIDAVETFISGLDVEGPKP